MGMSSPMWFLCILLPAEVCPGRIAAQQQRVPAPRPVSDLVTIHSVMRGLSLGKCTHRFNRKLHVVLQQS